MENTLYTYEPTNQSFVLIWIALGIFLICATGAIWLFRQDTRLRGNQYMGLLGMLVGFIALISMGIAIFGWLATTKTGTVKIYADRIELGRQLLAFRNIENAVIEESRETSLVNPSITIRSVQLLFITDRQGHTYVLSEENYPIKEIMSHLRQLTQ